MTIEKPSVHVCIVKIYCTVLFFFIDFSLTFGHENLNFYTNKRKPEWENDEKWDGENKKRIKKVKRKQKKKNIKNKNL